MDELADGSFQPSKTSPTEWSIAFQFFLASPCPTGSKGDCALLYVR